jgi:hypothetical protein
MSEERQAMKTPATSKQLFASMCRAWRRCFKEEPSRDAIILLLSHWALETGYGRSMWNFNLGNAKAKVGGAYDYCFFSCNEILSKKQAESMQKATPDTAKITRYRDDGTCIIWFYPKHPACCFRAFSDLDAGALDHLDLIHRRFSQAWSSVLSGDPKGFCHALRQQGYYTADESSYTAGVCKIFEGLKSVLSSEEITPEIVPHPSVPKAEDFTPSPLETPELGDECPVYSAYSMTMEESSG